MDVGPRLAGLRGFLAPCRQPRILHPRPLALAPISPQLELLNSRLLTPRARPYAHSHVCPCYVLLALANPRVYP